MRAGRLPTAAAWEQPFVSIDGVHFVNRRRDGGFLATLSLDDDAAVGVVSAADWQVADVLVDGEAPLALSKRGL